MDYEEDDDYEDVEDEEDDKTLEADGGTDRSDVGHEYCPDCQSLRRRIATRKGGDLTVKKLGQIGLLLLLSFAVISWGGIIAYSLTAGYEYELKVGGHIDNALKAVTPEAIEQNLLRAEANMTALGFTSADYGGYFYWDKTPKTSVGFFYEQIGSFVQRCDEVIRWRGANLVNMSLAEINDAYQTKINNVHNALNDQKDTLRRISLDAFNSKLYLGWYLSGYPVLVYGLTACLYFSFKLHCGIKWDPENACELQKGPLMAYKCANHKPGGGKPAVATQ